MPTRLLLTAALTVTVRAAALDGLDVAVGQAMHEFRVPGLAIAVVKDGRVIHSRGYGFRDVKNKLNVTDQTLFGIGSITKSFTVLALSTLVEEGKLDWDKPVRDYAPDFRLHDPTASALATARDLVSHRTGLPRHDSMWFTGFTRAEIFARLRHLEPSKDFRAAFQYNNLMYMAAGTVAERVSGRKWEDLVSAKIWAPLGMTTANFSVRDSERFGDWSLNYGEPKGDQASEIPATRAVEAICPAGCINANLAEMTRYLQFHMDRGMASGKRVLPARHFDAMITPVAHVAAGGFGPEALGDTDYGLGLDIARYRGHRLAFHTGTIGGYHSLLAFLPDDNAGVVVLQNRVDRNVPQLLSFWIWDRLLSLEAKDWLAHFTALEASRKSKAEEAKAKSAASRKEGTTPSHSLADYAGAYVHPAYGEIRVAETEGKLEYTFGGRKSALKHFHYDVFQLGSEQRVRFLTNVDGAVDQLAVRLEPAVREIIFERR